METTKSNRTFVILIVLYAILAAGSIFLPQGAGAGPFQGASLPAPAYVIALADAGIVILVYGGLGLIGLLLSRKLGLPDIWDARATNRQRFLLPALLGCGVGILIIVGDAQFSSVNGIGHFPHPPFPTSVVAALAAGIGEEVVFRLFFISFWTWLISRIILRGRWQAGVYWGVAVLSAIVFGLGHLPSLMYLEHWTSMASVSPVLILELILLNGILSLVAAYCFRKFGFLAPVGVHFWADFVWHVLWGLR